MTVIIEVKQKKNHKTRLKQQWFKNIQFSKELQYALSFIVFSAHVPVLISTHKNHLEKKKKPHLSMQKDKAI